MILLPESQNIEYKQQWRDEYLKWICGFANSKGGKRYERELELATSRPVPLISLVAQAINNTRRRV